MSRPQKSTIVRFQNQVRRAVFRSADLLAPNLAGRIARDIWFTVPPRLAATPLPDGGRSFEVESLGAVVRGHVWGDGPVVYLVHGWGGRGSQLASFVEPLLVAGFRVVMFDAPAHGDSDHGPAGRGRTHGVEFGKALVHREGSDLSVLTYGAMVYTAEEAADRAAENDGTSVEIIDLRTLTPWDKEAVLGSVAKTGKVLVLHEDTHTSGFGAEIAATIAQEAFENLDALVVRITSPDSPVHFAPSLEKAFLPQLDDVAAAIEELSAY